MAQKNRESHEDSQPEIAAEHYYDYEARFVKQKREQERINILPRVIKPAMFAKGEFALGDMRVFSRYTVAPLSMLTCGFLDLRPGAQTEPRRMIPSLIAYIIEGSGEAVQDGVKISFAGGDVVIIPPYTTYQFIAHRATRVSRLAAATQTLARPRAFVARSSEQRTERKRIDIGPEGCRALSVAAAVSRASGRQNPLRLVSIQARRRESYRARKSAA